jgi:hypothetical protein
VSLPVSGSIWKLRSLRSDRCFLIGLRVCMRPTRDPYCTRMGGEDLQASKHRQPASTGTVLVASRQLAAARQAGRRSQAAIRQPAQAAAACSAAIARAHSARGRPSPRPERCHAPNSTQT